MSPIHRKITVCLLWLLCIGCSDKDARTALGTIERDRIALTATANELVMALPVKQGQWVNKGDLLVKLDTRQQQATVNNALGQLARAEANMLKLVNGARVEEVAAARARLNNASAVRRLAAIEYERVKPLAEQDLASRNDLDEARGRLDESLANEENLRQQLLELLNGTRIEDLEQGAAEVEAAAANLTLQQVILDKLVVTATRSGWLDALPWNLGERVSVGSPVAIVLAGSPYVRVYIPEPYRERIRIGDRFPVRVDGIASAFTGYLRWISVEPAFTPYFALNREERTRLVYLAEVVLEDDTAQSDNDRAAGATLARNLASGVPAQVILPEAPAQ